MKLYDFAFSPNSLKVRAVAYELGIPFESQHVDLTKGGARTAEYLAVNPNGRVPTLVDGDFKLWESVAIIKYLADTQGGKSGKLVPEDARGRADVDRWLAWQLAHLAPASSKVGFERIVKKFVPSLGAPDEKMIADGTAEFEKLTAILDGALEGRDYVAGSLSVADFALGAHYSVAGVAGLDVSPFPRVRVWLGRMLARESMRRAIADGRATM